MPESDANVFKRCKQAADHVAVGWKSLALSSDDNPEDVLNGKIKPSVNEFKPETNGNA